jgi:hypothetical protein
MHGKHVFFAHFFERDYPIGNGLVTKSGGFGKHQHAKLPTLLGEGKHARAQQEYGG